MQWVTISFVSTTEELLGRKSSGSGLQTVGIRCAEQATPSIRKVGTNFADKLLSVGIFRSWTPATETNL
jgi:hypothetical protein